jgi:hypothetical protein
MKKYNEKLNTEDNDFQCLDHFVIARLVLLALLLAEKSWQSHVVLRHNNDDIKCHVMFAGMSSVLK